MKTKYLQIMYIIYKIHCFHIIQVIIVENLYIIVIYRILAAFQAIKMYQRALECVDFKNVKCQAWRCVTWELSTAYFTFASNLQDRPPVFRKTIDEVCLHF